MVRMEVRRLMNFTLRNNRNIQGTGLSYILQQSWRFEKEHRVSNWYGTLVGYHGCHYSALCVSYVECAFGRGGEGDERDVVQFLHTT